MPDARYWNAELETLPWADVERMQVRRVAAFIEELPARSAFFAERLRAAPAKAAAPFDSVAAIAALPFVTKADLRAAQALSSESEPFGSNQSAAREAIVQTLSSSGTTSSPMYYALTQRDAANWADAIAQVFYTCGIRPGDIVAHLVGLPMVAGGLPYADGFRRVGATLAWLGGYPTERILEAIPKLRASAVLATTSFGVHLADRLDDAGSPVASKLGVMKYLSGGEPGLAEPEIRRKIAGGWQIDHVREMMGLGDVLSAMWGECDDASGMHFNAQRYVYVELVEPETGERVPWTEGAHGEAVYTTFDRDAMPVLRYRSADHIVVTGTSCRCGRTSPKIRCIGRTDDMLIYKGMNVFPSAIRDLILTGFPHAVEPFMRIWKNRADQVRFDDPIPVDVEHRRDLDPATFPTVVASIENAIREKLQVRAAVTLVTPETIARGAYKTQLVHVLSG